MSTQQGSSAPAAGRAGRDLPAAIAVGLALVALVLLSLYVRREAFVAVAALAVGASAVELSGALATRALRVAVLPLLAGTVATLVATYAGGSSALLVGAGLTALAVVLWRLGGLPDLLRVRRPAGAPGPAAVAGSSSVTGSELRDITAGMLATTWLVLLAGFAILLVAAPDGARRTTVFLVVTVCSDVGGYTAGVLAGRHPMAPTVSPKKSWEGFAGSTLACLVGGVLGVVLLLHGSWWAGALVGLASAVAATLGDLSESILKRDLGIKDMGSLLPGHGGVLDRLDSLLAVAPVVWLLLTVLVPVR